MVFNAFLAITTATTAVEPPSFSSTMLMMMANKEPAILTKNSDEPLAMMVSI